MKTVSKLLVATTLVLGLLRLPAFAEDPRAAVQKALESQYPLTQPTGDKQSIVTAGAVLVLQKNVLEMIPVSAMPNAPVNTYKDGGVSPSKLGVVLKMAHIVPRSFVRGEKMYTTKIVVKDDGVYFDLFTDPLDDVRYKGALKFPFQKNQAPTPEQALSTVAQVFSVDTTQSVSDMSAAPSQTAAPQNSAPAQAASAGSPDAAPPPIAPPPPPADDTPVTPPTIAMNQTKQQVESSFGKPEKVVQMNRKEIYFYKNMKVTFTDGKVSHVE